MIDRKVVFQWQFKQPPDSFDLGLSMFLHFHFHQKINKWIIFHNLFFNRTFYCKIINEYSILGDYDYDKIHCWLHEWGY